MLIKNIDILKKYIPTIISGTFPKYTSFISDANNFLRREILGQNLYELIKDLSSDDELPEPVEGVEQTDNSSLVSRAEAVVALKAYIEIIPFIDLQQTESGFGIVRTNTIAPASPERVKALIEGAQLKLSEAIEELIDYLEEDEAYHDEWKPSPAYTILSDNYFTTLKQFRLYGTFEGNRFDFVKFKPKLLTAMNLKICPVISTELNDQIIEQLRDEDLSDANKAILENLRFALALFASGDNQAAQSYLTRVRKVLLANPDSYPEFKNSTTYAAYLKQSTAQNTGSIFRGAL